MLLEWGYVGAILAHQVEDGTLRPMAHANRTLKPHEQNYGATERGQQSILDTMDMPIQN